MNIHDPFPSFSSADKLVDPAASPFGTKNPGQRVVTSVHRTKIAGHSRLITVTWSRNLLHHGLCVSVGSSPSSSSDETSINNTTSCCKVELKPWCFWRKLGSKKFDVEGHLVQVFWDLRSAKFSGEPEPCSNYCVAIVSNNEIVLSLGDLQKEVYKHTGCRPAAIDATMVSKNEHVFGKKRFAATARFNEKGRYHDICIQCGRSGKLDPQMVVKVDGQIVIHVKHLQWKFRGNETVSLSKERVEVYWDVHDWLFSPGLKHALFIFKPLTPVHSSLIANPNANSSAGSIEGGNVSPCSFFLYAWKIE